MAKVVFKVVKPLVVLKALPSASSHEVLFTPPQPEDGGPEPEVSKLEESTPSTSQPSQQVQEQSSGASDTNSGKADEPTPEEVPPSQSLKVRLPLGLLKHGHKTTLAVPRMVPHPPKCGRNWRPRRPKPPPQPDLLRQPSVKLSLSCTKRIFQMSRKSVPGSSDSTRERRSLKRFWTLPLLSI